MKAQDLKNSILQLAIQGKLVRQREEEGTARELLKKIEAEKQVLLKAGKIKKQKALPAITEDEIPFEIPESWEWVRLGEIGFTNIGLTYKPSDISDSGTIVLRSSNIQKGQLEYKDLVRVNRDIPMSKMCHVGDILICARNGSKRLVGKSALIDKDGMSFGAFMAIFRSCCNNYIIHIINSMYFRNSMLPETGTTTINQITQETLRHCIIPLPPLAEQKRIDAKIEALMPYIDQYDAAYSEVEALNKKFPEELKKSILQYAIQGKLVKQRKEEGTAEALYQQIQAEKQKLFKADKLKKTKALPEITEDEIPFDIPESWKWVRLEQVCEYIQRGKSPKYSDIRMYPVVAQKCNQWSGFCLEKAKFIDPKTISSYKEERILQDGDLMWNSTGLGTLGRVASYEKKLNPYVLAVADSHVTVIRPLKLLVNTKYLYYYISNPSVQSVIEKQSSGSTKQIELSTDTVKNYIIPLPPLAEQKRIVKKVEELIPLIKQLAT